MQAPQFKPIHALAVVVSLALGCSPVRASLTKTAAHEAKPKPVEQVEVLLDEAPKKPFQVVADLEVRAIESPMGIELMRAEAAKAGMDGIYWIDCVTPRSGMCTAKGYVYEGKKKNKLEPSAPPRIDPNTVAVR